MASEWRETTLGEVTEFLSGGTPPKDRVDYWGGSVPWVSAKDMKRLYLDDAEDHLTDEGVASGTKLVPENSVLLLVRGMTLLNDVPICITRRPMTFNQDVKALRPKRGVRPDFLPYLLLGNKQRLLGLVDLAGHGTGRLNTNELNGFDVLLPPEPEQRAIAQILGALDDKIELNRRMNETLEAIARALFKSWFVDFDPVRAKSEGRDPGLPPYLADLFPDAFEDSDLGEIPAGWGTLRLGELLVLDKGLSYKGQFLGETGMPMVNLGCFLGRGRFAETAMKHYSGEFRDRHVVRPRDLMIANTDLTQKREVIGSPALFPPQEGLGELLFTHHVFAARFREGKEPWKLFVYFSLLQEEFRQRATGFATGTTVLALPRDAILGLQSAAPPPALIGAFDSIILPLIERQWKAAEESRTLTALRDTLLPNLISGELDVSRSREGGISVRVGGSRRERQGVG